jgi:hypothetical protein
LPWNTWREAEFKALQSLLLKQKVRYFVTASRTASVCSFLLSIHHRTRPGILPPTSPQHHAHAHTLLAFLFLRLPSSYLQLIQSTHTQHHLLSSFPCIDVGALISIQSSRQNKSCHSFCTCTALRAPAFSKQSALFVRLCAGLSPRPSSLTKSSPKQSGICTALEIYLTVDHDADFDILRLPISPTHTALDLPHSNSQHQR